MLFHAGRQIKTLRREGRQLSLAVHQGRQIYPGKSPKSWLLPQLDQTVIEDSGEKWFEVYFQTAFPLAGTPATGWTDPSGQYGMRLQRSDDLQTWDHDFVPAPGYPIDHGNGAWTYGARCKYPIDSDIKSGHCWLESGVWPHVGDARNNPFTSIVLAGVVQALPHYPYFMPYDAHQLQNDLRAVGWAGATVVATSANAWRIEIPSMNLTERIEGGRICWPGYLVPDMWGNLTIIRDHVSFLSEWVNTAGVRTAVNKQFCRLALSHLNPP
jgi:hypothetical protein